MISSMTGYATAAQEVPMGLISLELRSVNNRYLDIQFKLPEEFRSFEAGMREILSTKIKRGKIECRLTFQPYSNSNLTQQLNSQVMNQLLELNNTVQSNFITSRSLSVAEILKWPGILASDPLLPVSDLQEASYNLLQTTLHELIATRLREGEKLKTVLLVRLSQMRQFTVELLPRIPSLIQNFQEKLILRLQEAQVDCNDDRIRQELVLFASKIDIDEELSRLRTHLDEVEQTLIKGGESGKRLDFLMQELNRESNTIGSKSLDIEVSKIAVELKVLVEQMREQVQNIE